MKTYTRLTILFAALAIASPVLAAEATPEKGAPQWNKKMKELSQTLSELLPDVISLDRFNNPKNFKRIEGEAKKLAELTHSMPSREKTEASNAPDADPSIPLISDLFQGEAKRAYEELRRGRRDYARSVLRTLPNFCIACHTRSSSKVDLSSLQKEPPTALISRLEKAEYFTATRQFDRALSEYEAVVSDDGAAKTRQIEWERAFRHALSVAVRVKRDPQRALNLVARVINSPSSPGFLKEDALEWQKSLTEWQGERKRQLNTTEGLLAEAKNLISKAHSIQKYPADHSADMIYLRVTSTVHDLLGLAPTGQTAAEAFFLLGMAYEALQDLELWSLHEMYFETCIRKFPHTSTAQSCYHRYEESTYSGYTGSGGVALPPDVALGLSDLKRLSAPESSSEKK